MALKEAKEMKSLLGKRLIESFKKNIKELIEDMIEIFPQYRTGLTYAHLFFGGVQETDMISYMLSYIDDILVKNIDVTEANTSIYVDNVISIIMSQVTSLGGNGGDDNKEVDKELVTIKKDLNENQSAKDLLLQYWKVCNDITKKYIKYTPVLRAKYESLC